GVGWIPQPRWYDPLLTLWNFSFTYTGQFSLMTGVFLIVLAVAMMLGLRRAWQQFDRGLLLTLWLFFPPLIIVLLSFRYISFYVDRYLLIIAPILTVLTVGGLLSLRSQAWRWALTAIFVAGTALGLGRIYFDATNFAKEDWRAIARHLNNQAATSDAVITCTDGHQLALAYYRTDQRFEPDSIFVASHLADPAVLSDYRAAWVIDVLTNPVPTHYFGKTFPTDLDLTQISAETAVWEMHHRRNEFAVSGITAYRYEFDDPQPLLAVVNWYCRK
ncbi:MAG: hypothetical protein AB1801_27285, partial [Chloroflexota bacterium]